MARESLTKRRKRSAGHKRATDLKTKVKALHKKGLNDKQIGKKLRVSDSYVWVIRHNYKG